MVIYSFSDLTDSSPYTLYFFIVHRVCAKLGPFCTSKEHHHPYYIFCIRHPSSCVQSLNRRSLQNKFLKYRPLLTYRHFNLWYETNIRLLQFAEAHPNKCLVLDLPKDIEDKTKMVEINNRIQNTWGLKLNDIHFDGIYDKSLITSSKASRYVNLTYRRSRKIGQLYDRLLALC